MKQSPFEKITRLNAPGVDNAVKMPIEKGFNDDAGRRIIPMESIKKTLEVIANQPGTPIDKVPKPIIGKPGKPIIIKPITPKPKPGTKYIQ